MKVDGAKQIKKLSGKGEWWVFCKYVSLLRMVEELEKAEIMDQAPTGCLGKYIQ